MKIIEKIKNYIRSRRFLTDKEYEELLEEGFKEYYSSYCFYCNKTLKNKHGLAIHKSRMHL